MPNHLDFLEALDAHVRRSPSGEVADDWNLRLVAQNARLADTATSAVAFWTGRLIQLGFVEATRHAATVAIPDGVSWSDAELTRFSQFRITAAGYQEADRIRRIRREQLTDAALGLALPPAELSNTQRAAVSRPLSDLRAALDDGRHAAAIGAAKELVEAACKVALERSGRYYGRRDSLPALFRAAREALDLDDARLGPSLAAALQALTDLRNAAGSGHGRAAAERPAASQARLAAGTAIAIAGFLLADAADA